MPGKQYRIKLDSAGVAAILKSAKVAALVHDHAEDIAAKVRADPAIVEHELQDEVNVEDSTTDRAVSVVAIAHPAGRGIEGKHASLTKAVT